MDEILNNIENKKIKICGLTRPEEAYFLNEYKVDFAGFVFYEKSKRNISIDLAKEIMNALDTSIKKVAVTVSPDTALVNSIEEAGFDILQIHGDLDMEVLKTTKIPIWRAINIKDADNAFDKPEFSEQLPEALSEKIKGILMDAPDFGSGKPFNWRKTRRLLKAGDRSSPFNDRLFILAGGLNSSNVAEGIKLFDPDVVDVSTGVEGENGKSGSLIKDFVEAVRS